MIKEIKTSVNSRSCRLTVLIQTTFLKHNLACTLVNHISNLTKLHTKIRFQGTENNHPYQFIHKNITINIEGES